LIESGEDYLPRNAVLVLEPSAGPGFSTLTQPVPEIVNLLLRLTAHLKGHSLVERELGAAVERREFLAIELETYNHHCARGSRAGFAIARALPDSRALANRG